MSPLFVYLEGNEVDRTMAERSQQAQRVYDALEAPVLELGLELIDVAFVKEGPSRILRIYIDKTGGVGIDDCSDVSKMADPIIDNELNITSHDFLEVSSPGLERPLKTQRDFERYQGEHVEIKLFRAIDGKKLFTGKLAPCNEETIGIFDESDVLFRINRSDVARVKRIVHFE